MSRSLLLSGILLMTGYCLCAQSLYMPRDIQQAYKNGTRSPDGRPGKNYWQNKGRYQIGITATPPSRTIQGTEEIVYFNNSPDTIQLPTIKLFLNIHKPGALRAGNKGPDYLTSGMHIDAFSVAGQPQQWPEPNGFVVNRFKLPKPLLPGDSVRLSFQWHYDVSVESGREGRIDSTTFYLAYFYPRIAVYDDYAGWDRMNFTDQLEFYSDFNDYSVTINVPKDYLVWGTGTLQQPESLLQPAIAKRFHASMVSDSVIRIATPDELRSGSVTTQQARNNWVFNATNIPDMTFAISDHYVWDAASVVVDPVTKRRASVQAAYNDTAIDYHQMVRFSRYALDWFSRHWPGIPYPYEKLTVVQGYADMEYPMMVNDETFDDDTVMTKVVVFHEIAHTYMPFYMGINETRFGFMDEGWATTLELLIGRSQDSADADRLFKQFRVIPWIRDVSPEHYTPIITPGQMLSGNGLRTNQYGKPALAYLALKDMLGDVLFKKCLHAYMDRWNGKHPIPWDFFYTFNNVSGRDLNWFWNNWFFTFNHMDVALKGVEQTSTGYQLTIGNPGGFAIPFDIAVTYDDGSKERIHQTASVWQADQKQAKLSLPSKNRKAIIALRLDGVIYVDADESNNQWLRLRR